MKSLNLLFIFVALLITSCGSKQSSVNLKLKGAFSQAAGVFTNGAVMFAVGGEAGNPQYYSVPLSTDTVDQLFDNGNWNILVLGWADGTTAGDMFEGNLYCGVIKNASIPEKTNFELSLSQVDSDSNSVVDTGHPCEEFIDGNLTQINYIKMCEENTCSSGAFLHHNSYLSARFGIPFYKGPKNIELMKESSRLTQILDNCYASTDAGNGSTKFALDANDSYTGIILPRRLKGGFQLPLLYQVYEDDAGGSSNCSISDFEKTGHMNGFGEFKLGTATEKHSISGDSFIYKLPPAPFDFDNFPPNQFQARDATTNFDFNGPYGNDSYIEGAITYDCNYTSTSSPSTQPCPTTATMIEGGSVLFNTSSGALTLDGYNYPYFTLGKSITFNITANYTLGGVAQSFDSPDLTITMDPTANLNYAINNSNLTNLIQATITDNYIEVTNLSDIPITLGANIKNAYDGGTSPLVIDGVSSTPGPCGINQMCRLNFNASMMSGINPGVTDSGVIEFLINGNLETTFNFAIP